MSAFTSSQLAILQNEKDTDPLIRGYAGMSDQQLADSLNAADRDTPAPRQAILDYCLGTEFRSSNIFGRIQTVADLQPSDTGAYGTLPHGGSEAQVQMTRRHVAAAKAFLRLMSTDGEITLPLTATTLDNILSDLGAAQGGCFGASDRTALVALSENQQSRAQELGLPFVNVGTIQRLI